MSDTPTAVLAEEVGFDGLVANGNEVGGSVSKTASFILAQELRGRVRIPYWIRGGVGPRVAAAVTMAGAKAGCSLNNSGCRRKAPGSSTGRKRRTSTAANPSYWGATTTFSACQRDMDEARSRKSSLSAHAARIGVVSYTKARRRERSHYSTRTRYCTGGVAGASLREGWTNYRRSSVGR